jgi:zinc D-Ala-D-Ala carboxypeptidase
MKILILKNKGVNEKFVEKEIENLKFFKNIKKNFKLPNIPYTVEVRDIDFDVKVKKKSKASDGRIGYTLKTLPIIPTGFDRVAIMYDGVPIFNGGGNFAYSHKKRINGAFVTEIPDSSDNYVLPHELMHLECNEKKEQGFNVIDSMDKTKVNGKFVPYYKNNTPTAHLGNYHVTLLSINKYKDNSKQTLIDSIIAQIAVLMGQIKDRKKYKNFSELEVKGLDHDFVVLLDKARDIAGIPFVINSGFRTPEHNKNVGGVANSSHLSGKAVDLKAINDEEQWLIVNALMKLNIQRITVYTESNHIHCDMDLTLNYPRLTILNK